MPDVAAPCGLRTPHAPHSFNDNEYCPGIPFADAYEPKHAGPYKPERGWSRHLRRAPRHSTGDPDYRGPAQHRRPRPRIGWDNGDDKGDDQ